MAVDIYFSYSPSHIQYSTRGSNLENSKVWYFSLSYAYIYFAYVKCTFIIEVTLQLYLFILWNTMIWSMISIIITNAFHNFPNLQYHLYFLILFDLFLKFLYSWWHYMELNFICCFLQKKNIWPATILIEVNNCFAKIGIGVSGWHSNYRSS